MGVSLHTSQSQVMSPLWLATLLLSVLAVQGQQELQDFLGSCLGSQPSSAKINACLVQLAEKLRPFMKTGIAELGIPRTEPMDIDRINFALKSPFGVVDVVFTENSVAGLSNHEVKSVKATKGSGGRGSLEVTIKVIEATDTGLYHMSGVIGPLELDPSLAPAPYKTTFTGTTVSGVAQLTEQNGKLVILGEPDVTIAVEGLNVQMGTYSEETLMVWPKWSSSLSTRRVTSSSRTSSRRSPSKFPDLSRASSTQLWKTSPPAPSRDLLSWCLYLRPYISSNTRP